MRSGQAVFLVAVLTLAGCGDVNLTADDFTQSSRKIATSANDENQRLAAAVAAEDRPPQPIVPPPAGPELAASMGSIPGSSVRGESLLRPHGRMSIVSVTLAGGTSHTTYEGAIRRGSCEDPGSTIATLIPVSADSGGRGAAISYAQVPTDSLLKGSHVLTYGMSGRIEACGAVVSASGGGLVATADSTTLPAR